MAKKEIKYSAQAREKIMIGVDTLADAVTAASDDSHPVFQSHRNCLLKLISGTRAFVIWSALVPPNYSVAGSVRP